MRFCFLEQRVEMFCDSDLLMIDKKYDLSLELQRSQSTCDIKL